MEITVSQKTHRNIEITIFHLKGDLDLQTNEALVQEVKRAHDSGARYAVLDLTGVRYISSAGLRAIHAIFNLLREGDTGETDSVVKQGVRSGVYKSKHLKLANPSRNVQQAIAMAGYDMFMEIHPSVDSAVQSF
jgi:anti-anti-sigma factor